MASPNAIYKPALYAHFSKRADISIYVTFINEFRIEAKRLVMSPNLSMFFGLEAANNQVFLGVPEMLWLRFSQINWQSYSLSDNGLELNYHVDGETNEVVRTAIGLDSKVSFLVEELSMSIPARQTILSQIAKSTILHITKMDTLNVRDVPSTISVTKKLISK